MDRIKAKVIAIQKVGNEEIVTFAGSQPDVSIKINVTLKNEKDTGQAKQNDEFFVDFYPAPRTEELGKVKPQVQQVSPFPKSTDTKPAPKTEEPLTPEQKAAANKVVGTPPAPVATGLPR